MSTSPVSRSADSSTVASSSWRSSSDIRSAGSRRLPAAALIAVSGVRRSWPTAESRAVRRPAASARRWASVACGGHPPVAQGEQRLAADGENRARSGRGERAAGADEVHALVDLDVGVGLGGSRAGAPPVHAVVSQPVPAARSSSATVVRPNASRTRSSSLGSGSERESTTRANDASSVASARAVAAWAVRRSARSTTAATSSATTTIAPIANAFSGCATESVYSGGVRKTLSSSPPPSAATSAGASPPIMAVTTVARKNSTTSVERSTDSRSATPRRWRAPAASPPRASRTRGAGRAARAAGAARPRLPRRG